MAIALSACVWVASDAPAHATPPTPGPVVSIEHEADAPIRFSNEWPEFGAAGAGDNFLLFWPENRLTTSAGLRAARIRAADGALLDAVGFPVFESTEFGQNIMNYDAACRPNGTQCLVVVTSTAHGDYTATYTRLDPSTAAVLDGQGRSFSPKEYHWWGGFGVAPVNDSYAVLDGFSSATSTLRLHQIQGDGFELNSFVLLPGSGAVQPAPRIAAVGTRMLMMWSGDVCVATLRDWSSPTVSLADVALSTAACGQYDVGAVGGVLVVAWNDTVANATKVARIRPSDGVVLDSPPLTLPGPPGPDVRVIVDDTAAVIISGTSARLDPATGSLTSPAGAGYAGANGARLLGVRRAATSPHPIEIRRVQDDGTVIDTTPLADPQTTVSEVSPSVACGVDQCLAVWYEIEDNPLGGASPAPWRVRAARLAAGGASLDPTGVTIASGQAVGADVSAVAFDGSGYTVVWDDLSRLRAARIRASDGSVVAGPVDLGAGELPKVAVVGTTAIVAYSEAPSTSSNSHEELLPISVASLSPLAAPRTIAQHAIEPSIASDGTTALLAWAHAFLRTDPNGAPRDTVPRPLPADSVPGAVSTAFDGTDFVLAWNDANRIVAVRVRPSDGAVLDPTPIVVASPATTIGDPTLAFDGSSLLVSWSEPTSGVYGDTGTRGRRMRSGPGGLVPLEFASFPIVPDTGFARALLWSAASAAPQGGPFLVAQARLDNTPPYDSHRVRYRWVSADTLGTACSSISTCTSGYCVDGVCCDAPCGDGDPDDCLACSTTAGAASSGHCGTKQVAACLPAPDAGADTGGPDSSIADAGQAPSDGGIQPDAGTVGATSDASVINGPTFVSGGCDCETARVSSSARGAATTALFALALLARRRRARRCARSRA